MYPPNVMSLFSRTQDNTVSVNYLINILDKLISLISTQSSVKAPGKFGLHDIKVNNLKDFGGKIFKFFIMLVISAIFIMSSHISIKLP